MDGFAARRGVARRRAYADSADHRAVVDRSRADAIERGRQAGFHDYVAKFDRQGLIAALKEQTDSRAGGVSGNMSEHAGTESNRIRHRGRSADSCSACRFARCRTCSCRSGSPACRWRRRRSRACSICAAASSPRSTCAAGSACRARRQASAAMAVGIELRGESYGLLIDSVGEVLKLDDNAREPNPVNLDRAAGASFARGPSARGPTDGHARRRPRARLGRQGGRGVNGHDGN